MQHRLMTKRARRGDSKHTQKGRLDRKTFLHINRKIEEDGYTCRYIKKFRWEKRLNILRPSL